MKVRRRIFLLTLFGGLALMLVGLFEAGSAVLFLGTVIELVHSALTGKQTNDSTR